MNTFMKISSNYEIFFTIYCLKYENASKQIYDLQCILINNLCNIFCFNLSFICGKLQGGFRLHVTYYALNNDFDLNLYLFFQKK